MTFSAEMSLVDQIEQSVPKVRKSVTKGVGRYEQFDPATRQVELFLKAKRPKSALAVAMLRGFPWWRASIGTTILGALLRLGPFG